MIHFVGAGCGAKDLITVRGAKLLEEADVVIYAGSLVNPALLEYTKENCKIYNSAEMTLEEVMEKMAEAESKGENLVRLHTGDMSLYGAVREQYDRLDKLGIPYTVCPGVSAFSGAAASLKAEYTLPAVSQTVIITREEGRTKVPEGESIRALASHHASMVVFLSTALTEKLQSDLLEGGYAPDTSAAIVYRASWPDERVYPCTVGTIDRTVKENGIRNMALIVVGGFLGTNYERSILYHPEHSTGYRKAKG